MTWNNIDNPAKKIRFAREQNGRVRFLTEEEDARLLAQCGLYLNPLVVNLSYCPEPWSNVNFRREFITVRAGYIKNVESRSMDMSETLLKSLQATRINIEDNGTPYRFYRTAFTTTVRRPGIDDFTFHDLRHTFASRLAMAGTDLPTVQELMGHKNIKMTLRYAHSSSDHQRRAVGMMDQCGEKVATISATDDESRHRNISPPIDIKHRPLSSAG